MKLPQVIHDGNRGPATFHFPTTGITVDNEALLLAIDDVSLCFKNNLCLYISEPQVRAEPVLTPNDNPDAPDSLAAFFYGAVLHEEGKFRMWYYPASFKKPGDDEAMGTVSTSSDELNINQGPVCYAESDDGLHWTRPNLGQVTFRGNTDNNAIQLSELPLEGVQVIRDDIDPDPARRYKMIYNCPGRNKRFTVRGATSPDGISWTLGAKQPIGSFVEQGGFYQFNGLYIVNAQSSYPNICSDGGHLAGRQGVVWISTDFDNWLQEHADSFWFPEPRDPEARGSNQPYDQVHIGNGAATYGNVAVGLYCNFHTRPNGDEWFGMGTTSGDFGLAVSNDGIIFREPVKNHIFLDRKDSAAPSAPGTVQETILCQGNGILNVGDETWIYHGRWRNAAEIEHYYSEIALATLPRDRWGALGLYPRQQKGAVWTAPIALPHVPWELLLNADDGAGIRVDIGDLNYRMLGTFSGTSGGTASDSGLELPVTWQADRTPLAGQTVRLRFSFERVENAGEPRLFAAYLRCAK